MLGADEIDKIAQRFEALTTLSGSEYQLTEGRDQPLIVNDAMSESCNSEFLAQFERDYNNIKDPHLLLSADKMPNSLRMSIDNETSDYFETLLHNEVHQK